MPQGSGAINFEAYIQNTDFKKSIDEMERRIIGLTSTTVSEGRQIDSVFKNLGGTIAGYFAVNQLTGLAREIVNVRGEFQQLEIAFTTMLKSKDKATKLMQEITKAAAETPFELKEIAQGAKQLLAYGTSADTVVSEIKRIGDIAAGVGQPLNELIVQYGKIRTQGVAMWEDVNEIAGRGIPIIQELAKMYKVNENQIKEMASAGTFGFKQIEQAYINLTSNGGMFEGLMEAQSKSINGMISNLSDALDRAFNEVGQSQEGFIASTIKGTTYVVENYQKILDILKIAVATYGTYRAALFLVAAAHKIINTSKEATLFLEMARNMGTLTTATKAQAVAIGIQTKAQAGLNAVMSINPYVAMATVLAALAATIWVLHDSTTAAEIAQENLNKQHDELVKKKEELTSKTQSLIGVIQNETATKLAQARAFAELQTLYPSLLGSMDLETFKKKESAQAQKELNRAVDDFELSELQNQFDASTQRAKDLNDQIQRLQSVNNRGYSTNLLTDLQKQYEAATSEVKAHQKELENLRVLYYKNNTPLDEQLNSLTKAKTALEANRKALEGTLPPFVSAKKEANLLDEILRNMTLQNLIGEISKVSNDLEEVKRKMGTESFDFAVRLSTAIDKKDVKGLVDLRALALTENQIKMLSEGVAKIKGDLKLGSSDYKQLKSLYDSLTSKGKNGGEAPAPFGSIAYWREVAQKASKAIERLNPLKDKSEEIKKQQELKIKADSEVEKLSKQLAIKTFEEIFSEKRKQYELYEQWVKLQGQASANTQFAELKKTGENYQAYLKSQISSLEAKIGSGKGDNKDRENLVMLKNEDVRVFEEGIEEKKKAYELYNKWAVTINKETADEQFKDLIKQGSTIEEYLKNRIEGIRNKIGVGVAVDSADYAELVRLESELENINQGFEKYKEKILESAEALGSLTEQIAFFQSEQTKISPFDTGKILFLASQRLQAEKQRKGLLVQYFNESNLYEAKRFEIEKRYTDLRKQLDIEFNAGRVKNKKEALDRINADEKQAFEDLAESDAQAILKNSKGYQELQKIMLGSDNSILKARIDQTKAAMQDLKDKGMETTEEYKKLQQQLMDYQDQLLDNQLNYFSNIANILSQIKTEYGGLIGNIGKLGQLIGFAARQMQNMGNIIKLMNKAKDLQKIINDVNTTTEALKAAKKAAAETAKELNMLFISSAAQGVVETLNDIGNFFENNKKKQKEYYNIVISQQQQYNLLLNDEIRLKSQSNSLYKAPASLVIKDAINAQINAAEQLQASLGKLATGKAKDGTKQSINYLEAAKSLIFGLAGGLKGIETVDKLAPILEKHKALITINADGTKSLNVELAKTLIATNALDEETTRYLQEAIEWTEKYQEATEQLNGAIRDLTGEIGENLTNALVNAFKAGESAAKALGDTVAEVIENIVIDAVKLNYIKPIIDRLTADINASLGPGGDQNILDDMERFNEYGLIPMQNAFAFIGKMTEDIKKATGLDIFKSTNGSSDGLSGKIEGVTQESVSAAIGQFNALRITGAQIYDVAKINLDVNKSILIANIRTADNTEYLKSIDKKLDKLAGEGIRSTGL